jgi:hypothetical protein
MKKENNQKKIEEIRYFGDYGKKCEGILHEEDDEQNVSYLSNKVELLILFCCLAFLGSVYLFLKYIF